MAAAFFLGREGVPVTLYEASDKLGGVVRHIIPDFRISAGAIDRDEAIVRSMGVYLEVFADIIMLPGEAFVRAFGHLNGVGIGIVCSALAVGQLVKGWGRLHQRKKH